MGCYRLVALESDFLYRFDGLGRSAPAQKLQFLRFERVGRLEESLSSSIALAGSRRMSCRSPSKGERPGTTNTRSLRSFLPFDDWTTSSTPIGLHFSTRPG